jgi:hypothetical protein
LSRHDCRGTHEQASSEQDQRGTLPETAPTTVGGIYGYNHWTQAIEVGGVRLLSAQRGYPGERTNWMGSGIIDI